MEKPKKMKMPSSENWADLCPDADYPSGYNQGHDDFETYHNAILAEKDKKIGELEAEVVKNKDLIYLYLGGEYDGYGGKTEPITYKGAYEDDLHYNTWAMEEMKKACEKIKAHPEWKYGENAYPSPHERAIVGGCGQAVIELQAELTRLKASRLTVLEIENIIEHTSSFAPINVLAQSIHKAQEEKSDDKTTNRN